MTRYVLTPYRFTPRSRAMIDFYALVGLRAVVTAGDDFAVLHGRSGRLAVHALQTASSVSGPTTSLCFEVSDAMAAVEELVAHGVEARWWDEAFGRQAAVTGPTGEFSLNDEMDDFYGYQVIEPAEPSVVDVVGVVFTPEPDVPTAFFARLGFRAVSDDPDWRPLRADADNGTIGVHRSPEASAAVEGWATITIGFETSESLAALADRLRDHGHPVADRTDDPDLSRLVVTDPDGAELEIYSAA